MINELIKIVSWIRERKEEDTTNLSRLHLLKMLTCDGCRKHELHK